MTLHYPSGFLSADPCKAGRHPFKPLTMLVGAILVIGLTTTACDVPSRDWESSSSQSDNSEHPVHAEGLVNASLNTGDPQILAQIKPNLPAKTTSQGKEVTVKKADRILGLDRSGAMAASLWSMGMGDKLVGRDISTDFPSAQKLPLVTPGGHSINAEAVLDLNPDVIFTDGTIGPQSVFRQLEKSGITVVRTDRDRNLDNADNLMKEIGLALGDPDAGNQAAQKVRDGIESASKAAQAESDHRRMIMLYLRGTNVSMIAGPKSGAPDLIKSLGGVDAGEGLGLDKAFTNLTSEALVKAAPDTIIVMKEGLKSIGGLDGLHKLPGFDQTPAGAHDSVLTVPDSHLLSFGPDAGNVITAMAQALYGDSQSPSSAAPSSNATPEALERRS
ncbi:ABC transporter substrate-binding protein [Corynebacterium sp. L24]|nr:ABC transporter substrate-binding protein [Corynebacterium parakroppenstedtii]